MEKNSKVRVSELFLLDLLGNFHSASNCLMISRRWPLASYPGWFMVHVGARVDFRQAQAHATLS